MNLKVFLTLIKHEFQQSYRNYLIILLSFLVFNSLIPIEVSIDDTCSLVGGFLYLSCIIFLAAGMLLTSAINTTKTMFNQSSAFALTLPINSSLLIVSKVVVSSFWMMLSIVIMGLSVYTQLASIDSKLPSFLFIFEATYSFLCGIIQSFVETPLLCTLEFIQLLGVALQVNLILLMCVTFAHTIYVRAHRTFIAALLFLGVMFFLGSNIIDSIKLNSYLPRTLSGMIRTYGETMSIYVHCLVPYLMTWYLLEKKVEV